MKQGKSRATPRARRPAGNAALKFPARLALFSFAPRRRRCYLHSQREAQSARRLRSLRLHGCRLLRTPTGARSKMQPRNPVMTRHAEGTFDVKTTPIAADDATM